MRRVRCVVCGARAGGFYGRSDGRGRLLLLFVNGICRKVSVRLLRDRRTEGTKMRIGKGRSELKECRAGASAAEKLTPNIPGV